jgi:hypothetical protein
MPTFRTGVADANVSDPVEDANVSDRVADANI